MKRIRRMWWIVLGVALLAVSGLAALSLSSSRPAHLGVRDGRLADCSDTPNCVATQTPRESQRMATIRFEGDSTDVLLRLREVIEAMPRAKIVTQDGGYLHAEFTSRLFRFVDDVEFLIDDERKEIHFRSASRAGHSDLGVNRRRMAAVTTAFKNLADRQRVEPNTER